MLTSKKKKLSLMQLNELIKSYLAKHNLTNQRLAVACSAGLDSMALLKMLIATHPQDLIYCLHLDHGLRDDSDLAREFLEEFCEEQSIHFHSQTLKLKEISSDENTARDARYSFFEQACQQHNTKNILMAHNLNDQAETILFRLFRGTNSAGLQGIMTQRSHGELKIHRPLLGINRKTLEAYCVMNDVDFVEDSSNTNIDYARNRIRHNILPEALRINGNVIENINRLSNIISEEQDFLRESSKQRIVELGDLPWDLVKFKTLERIMQRKILEHFFTSNIDFVNDFLIAIELGGFHRINFAKNKFFTIKQKEIHLETSPNC